MLLRNFPFVGEVRLTVLTRFRERAIRSYRTIDRVGPSKRDFTSQSEIIHYCAVTMGKLSATICVPFGAETVENDPCTVGATRNYTAGAGNRQNTSAQAKERNRQAFQRRMAQKTSRIHVAEREFEASILDAASTARACSRVALKCNAARLSANTFKLTPYMSLCL